jgi:hypothetical protein
MHSLYSPHGSLYSHCTCVAMSSLTTQAVNSEGDEPRQQLDDHNPYKPRRVGFFRLVGLRGGTTHPVCAWHVCLGS